MYVTKSNFLTGHTKHSNWKKLILEKNWKKSVIAPFRKSVSNILWRIVGPDSFVSLGDSHIQKCFETSLLKFVIISDSIFENAILTKVAQSAVISYCC